MDLEFIISNYGYFAIALGVLLEGEAVLMMAGALAYAGLLSLDAVILSAFASSVATYHSLFLLGRRRGARLFENRPAWLARARRVDQFLYCYRIPAVLGYRLLYGTRTVIPLMLGRSGLSYRQFALLDVMPAIIWSAGFSLLGYGLGKAGMLLLEQLEIPMVVAGILAAGIVISVVFFARKRQQQSTT